MENLRKFWLVALLVAGLLWLIACGESAPATSTMPPPTTALASQPTPTLASGLPTLAPPTPVANRPDDETGNGRFHPPHRHRHSHRDPAAVAHAIPRAANAPDAGGNPATQRRFCGCRCQFNRRQANSGKLHRLAADVYLLYQLGVALQGDGRFPEAIAAFDELEAQFPDSVPTDVYLRLGNLHTAVGDSANAIAAYQFYLGQNPEMAAYVEPLLAEIYAANGETASVIAAYEAAVAAPAQRLKEVTNRQRLAQLYVENGRFPEAISQYDAIRDLARTEFTKGQMNYLAGMAYLAMEDTEAAYGRFQLGLTQYPGSYDTYLGLVQLVEAGVIVDEYQRGLVNFNAQSYQPAIAAFERAIAINPDDTSADAQLYIAWSYEALGNGEAALAALAQYAALEPAGALFEEANLRARAGNGAAALSLYQDYLAQFPEGADAALAAWRGANVAEDLGDVETPALSNVEVAVSLYTLLGTNYPNFADSAEALFLAGWLANGAGDEETALDSWHQLIQHLSADRIWRRGHGLAPAYAAKRHASSHGHRRTHRDRHASSDC